MSARTVDDVLAEFASDWHHEFGTTYNSDAMAEHIVKLETRLATLGAERAGVVQLDEWRVVDVNGVEQDVNGTAFHEEAAASFASWHDKRFPQVAPHRVMRVCLTPTTPEASDG